MIIDNGWILLHRKFLNWEWFKDPKMVHFFLYCLLRANHKEQRWKGIIIKPGQFVFGYESVKENTGLSRQSMRTCITKLKSTDSITVRSTHRFSIITIVNWAQYQNNKNSPTYQSTQKTTLEQPSNNPPTTVNNNVNNENNVNNREEVVAFAPTPANKAREFFNNPETFNKTIDWLVIKGIPKESAERELAKFISYWTERNKSGAKQRWELQQTFEVGRRLATWFSRIKEFNQKGDRKIWKQESQPI
jgi:hypothetical protein